MVDTPVFSAATRRLTLRALLAAFAVASAMTLLLLKQQVAGADFSCFWAGAQAALHAPARLYDFVYITTQQGWPLGPGAIRPFIYPPSALAIFVPFALAPYWLAYGAWVLSTGALFVWAGRRAGAPLWLALLPTVALVAYCGQITFLIGGLVTAGLALRDRRLLAGVLFGVAAAIKPQLVVMLPIGLLAVRDWRALTAAGLTGLALCLISVLVWGVQPWFEWLAALSRFQQLILGTPSLARDAITPYALLANAGLDGRFAFLLAPLAMAAVWLTFRRSASPLDRGLAVFAAALVVSPYAMNYELALFAPVVAARLARTDARGWPAYVAAAVVYAVGPAALGLLAVLSLPLAARLIERQAPETAPA